MNRDSAMAGLASRAVRWCRPDAAILRLAWALAVVAGCLPQRLDRCSPTAAGARVECTVPGWLDRSFELRVPSTWDGVTPLPVVVLLHGGGANRTLSDQTTCPDGDKASDGCLAALTTARGWAVAIPDGTGGRPLRGVRTWNAGGGGRDENGGIDCVSGQACAAKVDDIGYFRDLLVEVERAIPLDPARIYATGISNGGAMSHRLACELPDRFAAVVSVAAGNQHVHVGGACSSAAVMEIHGTLDRGWPYAGGGGRSDPDRFKVAVDETMAAWARRNGCGDDFVDEELPDRDPADETISTHRRWTGCARATELVRIDGGGHTWPGGYPYSERAGAVTRDFGSELILDFFDANPN